MVIVEKELDHTRPALVIVDPLYLAARGAKGSDLYEMGSHLERIQGLCQAQRASLVVTHHWNQTGTGTGAERFSGAGPSAWGRVLISVAPVGRPYEDPDTGATTVVLDLWMKGDEIPERVVRLRRRVWADDL
jgi:RecA-family ATPase